MTGSRLIRRLAAAQIATLAVATLSLPAIAPAAALAAGVANDDAYGLTSPFVLEDKAFTVPAPGVLANDSAGLCIVNAPSASTHGGTVSLSVDGSFTYTSPANYAGADSFSYGVAGVAGGAACPTVADDSAVVSLSVTQVNDAPLVQAVGDCDGGVTVAEDAGAYDEVCVALDTGPPNESTQELSAPVVEVSSTVGFSAGPTITDAGQLQFRPLPNDVGTATISVRVRDNGGTANGGVDTSARVALTITVTPVPDAPTATADSFGALKDRTLGIASPGVLANDTDVDGDALTAALVTSPIHGALTLAANGSFSYTPAPGFVGPDAFSYRASDGGLVSATRVVGITVSAVPLPSPTPAISGPPVTPEASVEPSVESTAEPTIESSASIQPGASFDAWLPSPSAPAATAAPIPAAGSGGPTLPFLLVAVLLGVLLVFAGAYYIPRWLQARRGEPLDPE